jgi:hypothetical protein
MVGVPEKPAMESNGWPWGSVPFVSPQPSVQTNRIQAIGGGRNRCIVAEFQALATGDPVPRALSTGFGIIAALGVAGCTGVISGFGTSGGGAGGSGPGGAASSGGGSAGAGSTGGASSGGGVSGGSSGGAGTASAGSTGAPDGGSLYQPVTVSSYVAKVKNLLTGLPPTDAEVQQVAADPSALEGLIAGWITSGPTAAGYQAKMLQFFANAFQQTLPDPQDGFFNQGVNGPNKEILQNLQESFARTAWQLVQDGQPFTSTASTTSFMLTPALMVFYARIDSQSRPDTGNNVEYYLQQNPSFSYTLEASKGPIDGGVLLDGGADSMVFYAPDLASQTPAACAVDPRVVTQANSYGGSNVVENLYDFLFGTIESYKIGDGGTICSPDYHDAPYIQGTDYTAWKMVTVRQPKAGESTTLFYDLNTIRALANPSSAAPLILNIPRVGFFTTPSFLAQWNTNASNQSRVTMNQALIVGLGHAFDGTLSAVPPADGGLAALDTTHAPTDSACFACHETLDPMRQFFRQAYSENYTGQTLPAEQSLPGVFAFDGVSQFGTSIYDLGTLMAAHPAFGPAWVEKLCTWANSSPCDETDPEFQRIVGVFQNSNYSWTTLVETLFSSPLVTYAADTQTVDEQGETFSIARQAHLCTLLSQRLGITDICGLEATTVVSGKPLKTVQTIAAGYAADQFGRGIVGPLLTAEPNLFMRAGLENMCTQIAAVVVDATGSRYSSKDPQTAISDMVTNVMGLTSDRSAAAQSILEGHFANASDAGVSDALKSTFVLACESPYVAGLGL